MSAPILQSIAAKDRTVILTYDQLLDDTVAMDVGDFAITSNGIPAAFTEVSALAFGYSVYIGVAELIPVALVTVNYNGGSDIQNLAGENAAVIINQQAANTSTGADATAPYPIGGTINGLTARIYFSEVLDAASIAAAVQFSFSTDDGTIIAGTGAVLVYGNRVTVTLASATEAADVVTVNYTQPGANPLKDPAANKAPSIFSLLLTNIGTVQTGFWTTRAAVENRWGEENTRLWSNKENEDALADPVGWQSALDDTDAKFNTDFLNNDYDLADLTPAWLATSPYAARFKTLATIWAGTELYFARGWQDRSGGGDEQAARDKMQGWRDYVDAELAKLFGAGLDIAVDVDAPGDENGFQSVDIVRDSDVVAFDENSNGL